MGDFVMTSSPSDVTPVTASLYDADWAKQTRHFDAVLLRELRWALMDGMCGYNFNHMAMIASQRFHWIEVAEREAKREREEK